VPKKNVSEVALQPSQRVFLVDKPGALQSLILAGHLAPPRNTPNDVEIEQANDILGGQFTSRVNMNLREDKHWSYGAATFLIGARGQRMFITYAPVQTDKTMESVQEVVKELTGYVGANPATEDEATKVRENAILSLPGSWETANEVGDSIAEIVRYGLADDYFDRYPERVKGLSLDQVRTAGKGFIHPDAVTWVIVGDLAEIREGVESLNLGPVTVMDADGNIVK